jgi:UDP-N-acetylglucosamine 3-dehydrogenase
MTRDKLRVGIIGAGEIAIYSRLPSIAKSDQLKAVAICRRNRAKLETLQARFGIAQGYTDWREMLDKADLDAVFVCSSHDLHSEHILGALERGLHVVTEKPMGVSAQAWAVVHAAKASGLTVFCHPPVPLHGMWRSIKE